jgi:hypothetical protein
VAVIRTTRGGATSLEIYSCAEGAILISEPLDDSASPEDALRRAAVLVPMALEVEPSPDAPTKDAPGKTEDQNPLTRRRTVGTLGLLPGTTIAPKNRDAVFTGTTDVGVLFLNGLWIKGGADLSSRHTGLAVKKNEEEGTEVGVTDFAFWLGLSYRPDWGRRFYAELGLAGKYTHAVTKDLTENKHNVEETDPAARGSVLAALGVGVVMVRFFALVFKVSPAVSFGERAYKLRGEEAVNLGRASLGISVGAQFFL